MADKKNLCAQIDIALHNRVTEEKDRLEMTTSQYIAAHHQNAHRILPDERKRREHEYG